MISSYEKEIACTVGPDFVYEQEDYVKIVIGLGKCHVSYFTVLLDNAVEWNTVWERVNGQREEFFTYLRKELS